MTFIHKNTDRLQNLLETKVVILANQNKGNTMNQSELDVKIIQLAACQ